MQKIYIHKETGCAYRLDKDGAVEFAALIDGNFILSDDDFTLAEYDFVGKDTVTHEGKEITLDALEPIIKGLLS